MYLKSLEISGFKSFAKKSSLTFNTPITGIVGPNGSGKSNVAESFRFVLGEQSIKSMRGKRGEDLIWNGGGDGPNVPARSNRASVRLVFDNSKRIFSGIDFDEVTLERVVHRDNTNEYLLNGSEVRLKDIVELLAAAHIGASGHHIISQGEADRILSASIRERREMIEDALGLKIYQWKKSESLRKLEKTEENINQVESLRREIAPHIKFLKKQVEKVEKAAALKVEIVSMYRKYFAVESAFVAYEKKRIMEALHDPEHEMKRLEKDIEDAKAVLVAANRKDEKSDTVITLENSMNDLRAQKDNINREIGRIEGEIRANERSLEKEKERMRSEESRTVYLRDVEGMVEMIGRMNVIDDAHKLFDEVMNILNGFISRNRSNSGNANIGDIESDIAKLQAEKKELEKHSREISVKEDDMRKQYENIKKEIEKEKDSNRDAEKNVFRIIARQNELRTVISALRAEMAQITHVEESLKRELGEAGIVAGREAVQYDTVTFSPSNFQKDKIRDDQEILIRQIEKIKARLEDAGGAGGDDVIREYRETEERDAFLAKEIEDLRRAEDELRKLVADLDARIDLEFKSGILKINDAFNKYFNIMFGGGKAELNVVREEKRRRRSDTEELGELMSGDIVPEQEGENNGAEGLEVNVSLPRKKVKGLMMLSGGERALTSIALLFAVSQVNPPPFIILDETDAALDEANSRKYGDMIENLSKHSQLILITHNRETMSRAGVLYGVTMGADGASRLLSIAFEDAVKVAK